MKGGCGWHAGCVLLLRSGFNEEVFDMGKVLAYGILAALVLGLVVQVLKAIFLLLAGVAALVALVWLYRVRQMACYAIVCVAAVLLMPKAVWPVVALTGAVWAAFELVQLILTRYRRGAAPRLRGV